MSRSASDSRSRGPPVWAPVTRAMNRARHDGRRRPHRHRTAESHLTSRGARPAMPDSRDAGSVPEHSPRLEYAASAPARWSRVRDRSRPRRATGSALSAHGPRAGRTGGRDVRGNAAVSRRGPPRGRATRAGRSRTFPRADGGSSLSFRLGAAAVGGARPRVFLLRNPASTSSTNRRITPGGADMAHRKSRTISLLVAATAMGSALVAAPAQAAGAPKNATGTAYHCYWRHVSGHWEWVNGHRTWIPPRSVRVCG